MFAYILQGLGYGLTAAAQPGPFQTFVLSQALKRGWRRALPVALAPLISDGPIIALALVVLTRVPDWLQQALNVVSGLFILYLAWGAYRSWRSYNPGALVEAASGSHLVGVLKAVLINAVSPGPYIFWSLITGPILSAGWREAPANGLGFLAGFYAAMVGTLSGLIVLFGTARQLGPAVNRALLGISAIALTGFGIYQLWQGLFPYVTGM
jgi:threonine/homoserine/homoserine lactone efflux protein